MCIKIPERELGVLPLAYLGMHSLHQFVSAPKITPDNSYRDAYREMGCIESFAKRAVGLMGYPVLMVTALVEAVVRLALCAIAILPALLFWGVSWEHNIVLILGCASLLSLIDAPLRCAAGIYYKVILDARGDSYYYNRSEDCGVSFMDREPTPEELQEIGVLLVSPPLNFEETIFLDCFSE